MRQMRFRMIGAHVEVAAVGGVADAVDVGLYLTAVFRPHPNKIVTHRLHQGVEPLAPADQPQPEPARGTNGQPLVIPASSPLNCGA